MAASRRSARLRNPSPSDAPAPSARALSKRKADDSALQQPDASKHTRSARSDSTIISIAPGQPESSKHQEFNVLPPGLKDLAKSILKKTPVCHDAPSPGPPISADDSADEGFVPTSHTHEQTCRPPPSDNRQPPPSDHGPPPAASDGPRPHGHSSCQACINSKEQADEVRKQVTHLEEQVRGLKAHAKHDEDEIAHLRAQVSRVEAERTTISQQCDSLSAVQAQLSAAEIRNDNLQGIIQQQRLALASRDAECATTCARVRDDCVANNLTMEQHLIMRQQQEDKLRQQEWDKLQDRNRELQTECDVLFVERASLQEQLLIQKMQSTQIETTPSPRRPRRNHDDSHGQRQTPPAPPSRPRRDQPAKKPVVEQTHIEAQDALNQLQGDLDLYLPSDPAVSDPDDKFYYQSSTDSDDAKQGRRRASLAPRTTSLPLRTGKVPRNMKGRQGSSSAT